LNPGIARLKLARVALERSPFPTQAVFQAFRSPEEVLEATLDQLRRVRGLHPGTLHALLSTRDDKPDAGDLALLETGGLTLLSFEDPDYPENLREIPDPPPILFVRGCVLPEDRSAVAVIGSRKASAYGISMCRRLVHELVVRGFSIVSGMARGVDAAAHWAALDGQGRTLAVLGTGVDVIYPKGNKPIFERILEQGALVSEFLPGTQPFAQNFPRRNRIISGMALGVLVVEAAERSGTMITVRTALEQGREIFAVPGDVRSPVSRGTHRLIKEGAKLVEGIEDILEEFPAHAQGVVDTGFVPSRTAGNRRLSAPHPDDRPAGGEDPTSETESLMGHMSDEGTPVDVLIERTGWPSEKMAMLLTELELLGRVRRLPGGRYVRTDGSIR
jgi:DNA processing protein